MRFCTKIVLKHDASLSITDGPLLLFKDLMLHLLVLLPAPTLLLTAPPLLSSAVKSDLRNHSANHAFRFCSVIIQIFFTVNN